MLVQSFKYNEIVSMKLTTGEEIVAKFMEIDDSGYRVNKPLVLAVTANGPSLTPFLFTASIDNDLVIPKNAVIAMASTEKQTAGQYIKGTTGIIAPTGAGVGRLF